MLLIVCPYCGPRSELEFRCGGQSHIKRPGAGEAAVSDESWASYLFVRDNLKGPHRERWLHAAGCGRWFNLVRDTVTHRISVVYEMGSGGPPSEPASEA
jgi:sarcosine oxidase subunit delta